MVIAIVFIFFIGFGFMGQTSSYGTWGPMGFWGGSMMFFPGIIFIFFIVMMFFMMSGKHGGMCGMGHGEHKHSKSDDDPLKTLKNRYAKGEITKKKYEDMKKEL
tara:strand:+ start:129 stop:440 length:312 start_codon:yes stop_codon:yes gene_type:complete